MQAPAAASAPLSFGHAAVARRLVAALEASLQPGAGSSTEPALVIGVFGEWGAGKSRLLQTVAGSLSPGDGQTALNVVVPFNAWRYEREEHLLVPLLRVAQQCLSKALEASVPEDIRRAERLSDRFILLGELAQTVYQHGGRELLQTALATQGVVFKLPELKKDPNKPEPPFWERWRLRREALKRERLLQTPVNQLNSLYYDFLEHLKAVTGRNPKALALHRERLKYGGLGWWPRLNYGLRRLGIWLGTGETPKDQDFQVNLVFLVDDLDRCLPDKAVEVLEAIKLFLEVEGCAFVLALDEEVVERGIAHRYRDYSLQGKEGMTPITGAEYLEKLVHLPVRLPRPTGAAARDFLAGKWPDWFADASAQANDLATLVAAVTPGVPRKLHRMTALLALAESLGAGDAKTPRRREWLAIVCALQLFAPALYRYLRLHGARLLITLADWRTDALFRDVAGLRKALQQQVLAVDSPAQLQYRLVLMRLPDLCEAVMLNRSGFDLLELLARVGELHEKAALTGAQLGALMVFTEVEAAAEAAAAVPPVAAATPAVAVPAEMAVPPVTAEMPAAAGPVIAPAAAAPAPTQPQAGGVIEPVEPAMPTTAPLEARLENERALVEAVNSGELELVRVALSREGAAMSGRVISYALWGQLRASRLMEQVDAWVQRGAPADATQFLLQELRPHLSQVAAFDLLRDFGAPVQRVLKRPDWAQDVRVGDGNVGLLAPAFVAGQEVWLETVRSHSAAEWHIPRGWACATHHLESGEGRPGLSFGSDERYGVHAAIHLGDLEQRLRWVPAGKSAMGSPKGPPEEGELRTISLSRGFWMANTACSVALWSRVMGTVATGDGNLPMTGISAADIEGFLTRLGQALPGCECRLPSEAEWEAACRAGSRTAWAFGNEVGPQHVHAASSTALPVAGLGPNAWGFFQMHGNVAELCRDLLDDGQRTAESWLDPEGPPGIESTWHAVRGGSFRTRIEQTRSAAVERVGRNADRDDMGFRFIVRARTGVDQPPA
ncbi:formylglycine-generating enzyme required for sulfatase activity [Pelomonas saccharophila]|uniref:Formylglycine-generating enzyme required for sulfatase activity n=1 Tax=Roseateles saccharophilus TaxID=304 RepID=A0ABU1YLF4_ROSSA|nr:P-loop NTPase fold protein [Roseateles saccharophilus]MDR7269692.1 formylglycine-generating enzyme required for sulfatase activity [Roseateles saccharophilus]